MFGQLLAILNTPVRFWTSSLDLARSDVGRSCAISNDSGGFQLLDTNVFFVLKKDYITSSCHYFGHKSGKKKIETELAAKVTELATSFQQSYLANKM